MTTSPTERSAIQSLTLRSAAAIRAEVEAMAQVARSVSAEELDAAMTRVRTASAAFRTALEAAEAGAQ